MSKLISTNPAKNYEVVGEVEISADEEITEKVAAANKVKREWKEIGVKKRIEMLEPIYREFKERAAEIAELITKEMGKPIKESLNEVKSEIEDFNWYKENAENILADEITYEDDYSLHKIVYEPIGTAAVITPWNFPFGVGISVIVSNLVVGNTAVFKISEECPLTGKLIEEIMTAHLPAGVFSEIYGAGDIGEKLARNDTNLICFTGSIKTRQMLYKIAAEKFIKAILEMGGSNPCIIFDDADIKKAIPLIYKGRFSNCGQICVSIKRLIVHEEVFDQAVQELADLIKNKKVGDPMEEDTDISSLAAKRQLTLLEAQVKDAIEKGANIISGEIPQNLNGAYFTPAILTNISKDMRVWKEEVFGPVLPVVKFKTEEEAIALANDTMYGLGSKVFTRDLERAKRMAARIEAGTVEINGANRWLSWNPFGG